MDAESEPSVRTGGQIKQLSLKLILYDQHLLCLSDIKLSCSRGDEPFPYLFKEWSTDPILKPGKEDAQRRLGDEECIGSLADASILSYGYYIFLFSEIHIYSDPYIVLGYTNINFNILDLYIHGDYTEIRHDGQGGKGPAS